MLIKIYKLIHNKFSGFFKSVFFLRYVIGIIIVASVLFLSIPHFLDFEKKEEKIRNYLFKTYNLKVVDIGKIKYNSLPTPHLLIENSSLNFSGDITQNINKIKIYPKLKNIYNFEKFEARKIEVHESKLQIDQKYFFYLKNYLSQIKGKILFNNIDLLITDSNNKILSLKKINYANFGFKKNQIRGEVINKKFILKIKNNFRYLKFKLLNTGVSAKINLSEIYNSNSFKGNLKGKILKSKVKFNFLFVNNTFEINKLFFRSKNLSFESQGQVKIKPYFYVEAISKIKELDKTLIEKININKILNAKDIIQKLNTKKKFTFENKKLRANSLENLEIETSLSFGRLFVQKNFSVSESNIQCNSETNLLEEYPVVNFQCNFSIKDLKNFFKKLKIDAKSRSNDIDLKIIGNLNILNNKISFEMITLNNNLKLSQEDLVYYKTSFENIMFDKNFLDIFKLSKLRRFLNEIS